MEMMRKFFAFSVLVILVGHVAIEAQASPPSPISKTLQCGLKCGLQCASYLPSPPKALLCLALCLLQCKISPSHSDFQCTRTCAQSKFASMSNDVEDIDVDEVAAYVDSCYQGCKNN